MKVAIVTGANRGMGRAVSEKLAEKNYHVIMVGKNKESLEKEVQVLTSKQLSVEAYAVDMQDEEGLQNFCKFVAEKIGNVDVLINNAGIYLQEDNLDVFKKTLAVNTTAPYILMKGLIPLMQKNGFGRVVNVSSGLGSFAGCSLSCPAYCTSKAALNMLTKLFSQAVVSQDIKVNSICPGWVKTDMGGENAPRTVEQGIAGMIWAATLGSEGPSGGFFRDGVAIDW